MAIAADFERVYEIGPVFRAEDSNTHRHLTEFVGLDLEMTIDEHYHEVLELLDGLFKHLFKSMKERYQKEIDTIGAQFPAEEFKWKEETLKLTFSEAVDLLAEDGVDRGVLDDIKLVDPPRLGLEGIADRILEPRTRKGWVGLSKLNMTRTTLSSINSQWSYDHSIRCQTQTILWVPYCVAASFV